MLTRLRSAGSPPGQELFARQLGGTQPNPDERGIVHRGGDDPHGVNGHELLRRALSGIPDVAPGDSVWWHCDMIHSVAPVEDQQGWGNVMYIPAAPWCAKNAKYTETVLAAFREGRSPLDFPTEDYEATWADRFPESRLNEIGRRGLGL